MTTYTDPRDGSTLEVYSLDPSRALKEPLLRFLATEGGEAAAVDLIRGSVKALVEQATKWLEDTEPPPPTLPSTTGSVVRADNPTPAWALLLPDGKWYSKFGPVDPSGWPDGWVVEHDAGA